LIQRRAQSLDYALGGLFRGLDQWLSARALRLSGVAGRLQPPETKLAKASGRLSQIGQRFEQHFATSLANRQQKLDNIAKLLDANSFERVLDRGFTLVTDAAGVPIKRAAAAADQANVMIRFADGTRGAVLDGDVTTNTSASASSSTSGLAQPVKAVSSPEPNPGPKPADDDRQDKLF
jgi:exodeoxyribonuclease VII large subunit